MAVDLAEESGAGRKAYVVGPEQFFSGASAVAEGLGEAVAVERLGIGFSTFRAAEQRPSFGIVDLPNESTAAEPGPESGGIGGGVE